VIDTWRAATGAKLGAAQDNETPSKFADSPTTPVLAVLNRSGSVDLLDVTDPQHPELRPLAAARRESKPLAVGFSETGASIYVVYADGTVLELDATTGSLVGRWSVGAIPGTSRSSGSDAPRLAVASFDPQGPSGGERLLVATADAAVVRVDLEDHAATTLIAPGGVGGRPLAVAEKSFSPAIAMATTRGLLMRESPTDTATVVHGVGFTGVAFDGEGRLWVADRDGVYSQELLGYLPLSAFAGRPADALSVGQGGVAAIDPGGAVSTLARRGVGIAFNLTPRSSVASFDADGRLLIAESFLGATYGITLVRPGYKLEDGGATDNPEVRDFEPARSWLRQEGRGMAIDSVAVGGGLVAAGGEDGAGRSALFFWNAATGKPVKELVLSSGDLNPLSNPVVTDVIPIPGRHLVAAYSVVQQTVSVWSTDSWRLVASVPVIGLSSLALDPDEDELVAVSRPGREMAIDDGDAHSKLFFIDPEDGHVKHEVTVGDVSAAAWSPDGEELALTDADGTLRLRSGNGGEELHPPIYLPSEPTAVAWRPDGAALAVGVERLGTVLVDPRDGAVSTLPGNEYVTVRSLDWSRDGRQLAVAVTEENGNGREVPGPAEIWKIGPAQLQRRMCELAGGPTSRDTWRRLVGGGVEPRVLCPPRSRHASGSDASNAGRLQRGAIIAFRRGGELLAADRSGNVARLGRVDGGGFPEVLGAWNGGSFAWNSSGEVGVLAPGDRQPTDLPCSCSGLAWHRGHLFTIAEDGQSLLRLGGMKWVATPISGVGRAPRLLGFIGGRAIVVAYATEPERGTPSTLYEVGRHGVARPIFRDRHGGVFGPSAQGQGDGVIAFTSFESGGACFSPSRLGIIRASRGGKIEISYPPMPAEHGPAVVKSVGISRDGRVEATIGPIGCREGQAPESPPSARHYRLDDAGWRPTEERGFDVQRSGSLSARIAVPPSYDEGGPLTLGAEGGEWQLGGGVEQMWLRPE
jgi:WD40 repeat protein